MVKLSSSLRLSLVIIIGMSAIVPPITFAVTWSEGEYRLTTYTDFDGFPSVIEMDNGAIWIVWARNVYDKYALYYKTSHNSGATWSSAKNLTRLDLGDNKTPWIIQLMNSTIMVVWSSNRPPPPEPSFSMVATPESLSIPKNSSDKSTITVTSINGFSGPVDLRVRSIMPPTSYINGTLDPTQVTPPPNGDASSTLTITVDSAAELGDYTIWVDGTSQDLGKTHGVSISLNVTSSSTSASTSSGEATPLSTSSVETEKTNSETEDYEIFYKTSDDYGVTWSNDIQLTDNAVQDLNPAVVQLKNGTIMIVWQSDMAGNPNIYYITSSDGGASWSIATPLTTDPNSDASPSITQTKDGKIWVVWSSYRTGEGEIFYKIYNGSLWSHETNLSCSTKSNTSPSILQTLDETLWVFWSSEDPATSTDDIYYMYSIDNGVAWSGSIQFTTDNYVDTWTSTTQTSDKKIWVVWTSNRGDQPYGNWDIYYMYSIESIIHDVAITKVEPATSIAEQGDFISITVVVENQGSTEESFEVSCYANSTLIGSEDVTSLDAGSWTEIYLTWNTTDFAVGIYVISATASQVEGEVDTNDNTLTDGTVELTGEPQPIHDVAIMDVTPDADIVLQGDTVSVDVTAQNQGTEAETFDVTCEVNSTSIGSQTITLDPTTSSLLTFTWDTSGYAVGNYVISATASPVPGEEDTGDNIFVDGIVEVVAQPVHDVAVTEVTPSPTSVVKGQLVYVDVTVKNEGTETETFRVTAKYDDTEIGTQTVTSLAAGDATTKTFTWNTTGVSAGNYTIKATAEAVQGEVDTSDNTFVDGTVTILPYRDIAISDVTAYPSEVVKPNPVSINVTVVNEGELGETFNAAVYYNGIEIDYSHTGISLETGANTTLTFIWNTTAVDAGTYTISAKVSAVPYETDTDDNTFTDGEVTVTRPPGVPVASFTWSPSEPLVNEIITFDASESSHPDGLGIVGYEWDFGDGANGTGMIVNHTYVTTGQFRVTLTVKDDEGNSDSVMRIVTVYRRDVAIVSVTAYPTKVVVGELVFINVTVVNVGGLSETFNVTAYYNTTQIETQTVNLLPAGANITLTFVWNTTGLATGQYVLQANASPVPGETDIADNSYTNGQITLTMFPLAVFTYTPPAPLVGGTITFDATESKPYGGVITQYKWAFGDGKTGWGKIMEYSYATRRTYIVRLTITDSEGLTDSTTKTVTVHAAPIALFTYTPNFPKAGEPITFNASASYNPEGSAIVSYTWDFGDNATGTGMIITHTYKSPENYTVTLTIKDILGNEDIESMTITVNEATLPSSSWPLEIVGIVAATIAVGVILTALFFRKRKGNVK